MMDWFSCPAVERDPEKVSGSWVFRDTRVPVVALFENLEGGATVSDFLSWFPGVTREQVEAVLEYAIQSQIQEDGNTRRLKQRHASSPPQVSHCRMVTILFNKILLDAIQY